MVKIVQGRSRIVILLPKLGVVIKFPIIHFVVALRVFLDDLLENGKLLRDELFRYTVETYGSLKQLLFKGVVDNWREWRFFRRTRHAFCQPTYFSFFGLVNIQRFTYSLHAQKIDPWLQLHALTNGAVFKDPHHFGNPNNFCLHDGMLMILDYGEPITQEIVLEFGDKILHNFKPSYGCEKEDSS